MRNTRRKDPAPAAKSTFVALAPAIAALVIDQGLKLSGWFDAFLIQNHGMIGGALSHSPADLKAMAFALALPLALIAFTGGQLLLPGYYPSIRAALGLVLGGIASNAVDRLRLGHAIDFMAIGPSNAPWITLNPADLLQLAGILVGVVALTRYRDRLLPRADARSSFLPDRRYQLWHAAQMVLAAMISAGVVGLCSFSYFRLKLGWAFGFQEHAYAGVLSAYLIALLILTSVIAISTAVVALLLSHRVAGPLQAFQRFLDSLHSDSPRPLRLRDGDQLRALESNAKTLIRLARSRRRRKSRREARRSA